MNHAQKQHDALPRWLVVGFSGHRTLSHPENIRKAISHELNRLIADRGPRLAGVCSAASGGDTLFAEEMLERECPLTIVLPFTCERFKEDFDGDHLAWSRSLDVIQRAREVDVIQSVLFDKDVVVSCEKPVANDGASDATNLPYMDAGYRTIDRADVLLAVWDGREGKGPGGTADAVRYAIAIGLPLIIITPDDEKVTRERLDKLPVVRAPEHPELPIDDPMQFVQNHFDRLDTAASVHAPKARRLIQRCLLMHLGASILVVLAVFLPTPEKAGDNIRHLSEVIAIIDVAVLAAAYKMLKSRGQSYYEWLSTRAESEICRSFLATWQIRRQARVGHQPHPALPGLEGVFASLRVLRQLDESPKPDFEVTRSAYYSSRLMDQLNYFKSQYELAIFRYRGRKVWMRICTIGAISSSLSVLTLYLIRVHLAIPQSTFELLAHGFEFCAIVLPLATASVGLMLLTDESSRRMVRFREMIGTLEYFEPRIRSCRTWDALARLVTSVETALLQEVLEWQSFVRHTEDVA